ncbi:MAG: capsule assembly Wzi family protein [Cyclobacteriaceae bacterium]|nr:capsule assembly Wzi family protein [Cyclobacteriaceae bacterium]
MKTTILTLFFFCLLPPGFSQTDSLSFTIQSAIGLGSGGYLPLYSGYRQHGKLNPNQQDGYLETQLHLPLLNRGKWKINTGVSYVLKPKIETSFFHEGFLNTSYGAIELRLGKNEMKNDWYNDVLGSGNFFHSTNARTITKAGAGIYTYTELPFFKYVEIKGALEVGLLEKDRPVSGAYYHEKFAYLKLAHLPFNPYVGLNHNAIFGGIDAIGQKLPSNFMEVFFAKNATNTPFIGDMVNAAGAHFGLFDLGFELPLDNNLMKVYFQQPISDNSGYLTKFSEDKDYIIGIEMELAAHAFLKGFLYENIYTQHQSGEGTSDPIINNQFYTLKQLNEMPDYDAFILNEYGITTSNATWDEFYEIIRDESNQGYRFNGRDDYYNNGYYPKGNTFHDMVIGTPLFTTKNRFEKLTGETLRERSFIINNRIQAHHVGIAGYYKDIAINFWFTFTYNMGTYAGKYGGNRFSWVPDTDYYFIRYNTGLQYLGLQVTKPGKNGLAYDLTLGLDEGRMGHSFGGLMKITYQIK